jgi:hypothetical protein
MRIDKTALKSLGELMGSEEAARKMIEERARELISIINGELARMHEYERQIADGKPGNPRLRRAWSNHFEEYQDRMRILVEIIGDRDEAVRLVNERMN